ncbi:hypothetical protein ACP70R_011887 [Stipagrostis hirtigluma subsp. patula]
MDGYGGFNGGHARPPPAGNQGVGRGGLFVNVPVGHLAAGRGRGGGGVGGGGGMDSDDALLSISDDDIEFDMCSGGPNKEELVDDVAIDESIFELIKKHQIKKLKRRLGSAFLSDLVSRKSIKKGNHEKANFSNMCSKCFSDVISGLSSDQIAVIERFGFGCVLRFSDSGVPKSFVKWISTIVDVRTSELVLKDRVIPFSKHSVHKILGVPVGGQILGFDYEAGKSFLLSKFGIDSVHSILFFANKLVGAHDMSDEEVFICFMIIAIGCFFCTNSYEPLIKLLHVLEHPTDVNKYDWAQYLFELSLEYVAKLRKQLLKPKNDSIVMCSSAYIFAVLYLDCLNLGSYYVSPEIPRTTFWKASSIKFCAQLDEIKPGKYGRRPLKQVIDTSYCQKIEEVLGVGVCSPSFVAEFNSKLESLYGHVLPEELKLGITQTYASHCVEQLKRTERSCEELLFKIFSFCNEISEKVKYENSLCEEPPIDVPSDMPNGDANVNLCPQNLLEKVQDLSCAKKVFEGHNVGHSFDLSLKIGVAGNIGKFELPATPMKVINDVDVSCLEISKCPVEDHVSNRCQAKDALRCKELDALPQPTVELSTPGFINLHDISSSAPSCLKADHHVVKGNKIRKGEVCGPKPSVLDLNTSGYQFSSQDFITPNDHVIEVDTLKKVAEVKDIFDVDKYRMDYVDDACTDGSKFVFDLESHQYIGVRNDVLKEKFVSKSGNFLSKLQIHDLNLPFVQTQQHVGNQSTSGQVNADLLQAKNCMLSTRKAPDGCPKDFVCVPDSDDENGLPDQAKGRTNVIDLDEDNGNNANDGNDVKFMGEISFKEKIRSMCNKSELLYNKKLDLAASSVHDYCAGPSVVDPAADASKIVRPVLPLKYVCRPVAWSSKFVVTEKHKRMYLAACRIANSTKWNDGCYVKYRELGNSLMTGSKVGSYVINALCPKIFLDKRPTISRKHYFFSSVGAVLLKGSGNLSYVKKCFDGAASVLPLHKADMLLFPICHAEHWFVFIVDIKNSLFVFLDSYYSGDDEYHGFVRSNLIPSLKKQWDEMVRGRIDFERFDIVYPIVPKQNNLDDCGIFVIMFLTYWTWYCGLCIDFSQADIDNIRIYTVCDLVCSEHNIADASPITNYFELDSFARVDQMSNTTVQ